MRAIRSSAPAFDVLSLAEVKAHLRVDFDDEDSDIAATIAAATAMIDAADGVGFALAQQEWTYYGDAFPRAFVFTISPVISVAAVEALQENGTWAAVDSADYRLSPAGYPARVTLAKGAAWPASLGIPDCVRVRLVCGHQTAGGATPGSNIPQDLRQALKLIIGHWHKNREAAADRQMLEIPFGAQAVLDKYARARMG